MVSKEEQEEFIYQATLLQAGNSPSFRTKNIAAFKTDNITKLDLHAIKFSAMNVEKVPKIYRCWVEPSKEMIQCNIQRYRKLVSQIIHWNMEDIHELIFNMNLFWLFHNYKEQRSHLGSNIMLKCYDFDPAYSATYVIPEAYLRTNDVANIRDINVNRLKSAPFDKKAPVKARLFAMDKRGNFMVQAARNKDVLSMMYAENPPWHRWRFSQRDMLKPAAKFTLTDHVRGRMQDPAKRGRLNWNVYFASCEAISQGFGFRSKAYENYILKHIKPRGISLEAVYQALNEGVFVEEEPDFGRYEFASETGVLVVKVDTINNTVPTVYYKGVTEDRAKILVEIENVRKELIENEERDGRLKFFKETFKPTKFIVKGDGAALTLIKMRASRLYRILESAQYSDFGEESPSNGVELDQYIYRMGLLCEVARLLSVIYDNCDNINDILISGFKNTIYYTYAETFKILSQSELITLFSTIYKLIIDGIPDQGLSPLRRGIEDYRITKPNLITSLKDCLSNHALREPQEPIAAKLSVDKQKLDEIKQYCSSNQRFNLYQDTNVANILVGNCIGLLSIWVSDGVITLSKKQNARDLKHSSLKKAFLQEYEIYVKPGVEYKNNTIDYDHILCLYNISSCKVALTEASSLAMVNNVVQSTTTNGTLCDSRHNQGNSEDTVFITDLIKTTRSALASQAGIVTSTATLKASAATLTLATTTSTGSTSMSKASGSQSGASSIVVPTRSQECQSQMMIDSTPATRLAIVTPTQNPQQLVPRAQLPQATTTAAMPVVGSTATGQREQIHQQQQEAQQRQSQTASPTTAIPSQTMPQPTVSVTTSVPEISQITAASAVAVVQVCGSEGQSSQRQQPREQMQKLTRPEQLSQQTQVLKTTITTISATSSMSQSIASTTMPNVPTLGIPQVSVATVVQTHQAHQPHINIVSEFIRKVIFKHLQSFNQFIQQQTGGWIHPEDTGLVFNQIIDNINHSNNLLVAYKSNNLNELIQWSVQDAINSSPPSHLKGFLFRGMNAASLIQRITNDIMLFFSSPSSSISEPPMSLGRSPIMPDYRSLLSTFPVSSSGLSLPMLHQSPTVIQQLTNPDCMRFGGNAQQVTPSPKSQTELSSIPQPGRSGMRWQETTPRPLPMEQNPQQMEPTTRGMPAFQHF